MVPLEKLMPFLSADDVTRLKALVYFRMLDLYPELKALSETSFKNSFRFSLFLGLADAKRFQKAIPGMNFVLPQLHVHGSPGISVKDGFSLGSKGEPRFIEDLSLSFSAPVAFDLEADTEFEKELQNRKHLFDHPEGKRILLEVFIQSIIKMDFYAAIPPEAMRRTLIDGFPELEMEFLAWDLSKQSHQPANKLIQLHRTTLKRIDEVLAQAKTRASQQFATRHELTIKINRSHERLKKVEEEIQTAETRLRSLEEARQTLLTGNNDLGSVKTRLQLELEELENQIRSRKEGLEAEFRLYLTESLNQKNHFRYEIQEKVSGSELIPRHNSSELPNEVQLQQRLEAFVYRLLSSERDTNLIVHGDIWKSSNLSIGLFTSLLAVDDKRGRVDKLLRRTKLSFQIRAAAIVRTPAHSYASPINTIFTISFDGSSFSLSESSSSSLSALSHKIKNAADEVLFAEQLEPSANQINRFLEAKTSESRLLQSGNVATTCETGLTLTRGND
ncbi:MAG: hypothetical protein AB1540_02320 [Bdellovibrionota bacterium]